MRRAPALLATLAAALCLSACDKTRQPREIAAPETTAPTPAYSEIAEAYNARVARLDRVWARAVVSTTYRDEEGTRRSEQGEGHFQFIAPASLALSVGKLGETYLWVGSDTERYWLLDPKESKAGIVGRHDLLTDVTLDRLGLPAAPLDLIRIATITPMPLSPSPPARVAWSSDGDMLVVDLPGARGTWRYWLEPREYLPQVIELIGEDGEEVVLTALLERYERVTIRGEGGFYPQMPARVRITHRPSGSTLSMTLTSLVDGGGNRLAPEAFDLEALVALFGITDLRNADAPASASAESP